MRYFNTIVVVLLFCVEPQAQNIEIICFETGRKLDASFLFYQKNKLLGKNIKALPDGKYDIVINIGTLDKYIITDTIPADLKQAFNTILFDKYGVTDTNGLYTVYLSFWDSVALIDAVHYSVRDKYLRARVHYSFITQPVNFDFSDNESMKYPSIRINRHYINDSTDLKVYALYYTKQTRIHGDGVRTYPDGRTEMFSSYHTYYKGDNSIEKYVVEEFTRSKTNSETKVRLLELPTEDLGYIRYELDGNTMQMLKPEKKKNKYGTVRKTL